MAGQDKVSCQMNLERKSKTCTLFIFYHLHLIKSGLLCSSDVTCILQISRGSENGTIIINIHVTYCGETNKIHIYVCTHNTHH